MRSHEKGKTDHGAVVDARRRYVKQQTKQIARKSHALRVFKAWVVGEITGQLFDVARAEKVQQLLLGLTHDDPMPKGAEQLAVALMTVVHDAHRAPVLPAISDRIFLNEMVKLDEEERQAQRGKRKPSRGNRK